MSINFPSDGSRIFHGKSMAQVSDEYYPGFGKQKTPVQPTVLSVETEFLEESKSFQPGRDWSDRKF
jgi:hypothetical protein